ncbi:ABC transporter permease [Kamptonema cortianum]|nr:ABC transporter permease [Geitlerinema splendidum]MDK3158846.1 ABC transporter permease [Kamptonema cortianum]
MKTGVRQVLRKELREMARDKRVIQGTLVMPVFIIALMVILMGVVQQAMSEPKSFTIALVEGSQLTDLRDSEGADSPVYLELPSWEAAVTAVRNQDARLAIQALPKASEGRPEIRVAYDSTDPMSQIALASLRRQVEEANIGFLEQYLASNGLSSDKSNSIKLEETDIANKEGLAGSGLVDLIAYLIVLWAFYGGLSIVSDLVAGEKERGTMETLVVTPVRRAAVALGKIGALSVVCLLSSITTLVGIYLLGAMRLPITKALFPTGLHLSWVSIVASLCALLPLVLFFASMMVCISAWARNIRESQTYLGLVSFIILMPAIFSQFIGFTGMENAVWVKWTPVLNTSIALKGAIKGDIELATLLGSIGTSLLLTYLFGRIAISLFRREQIVLRV